MSNNMHTASSEYKICTNCVMDTSDPQITFDDAGRCDFCENFEQNIRSFWHPGEQSEQELRLLADKIKSSRCENSKYDCLIGFSGGSDSSYLAYIAVVRMGLKPLLIEVDTGWNLEVANENISAIKEGLGLDSIVIKVDWGEMRDLQVAFLQSGVPYQDLPQDQAIFAALCKYAVENGYRYILTGANYSTECVKPPQEWTYFADIRMIKDINRRFGKAPLEKYPLLGMFKKRFLYRYIKGVRIVSPLNLVPYTKEVASRELGEKFGWEEYENKHYENRFTRFYEGWWLPRKFGYDKRRCYESSLILTEQKTRDEALRELDEQPYSDELAQEDKRYICQKLAISETELDAWFFNENKTFRDYRNNFTALRLMVKLACVLGIERRNFR